MLIVTAIQLEYDAVLKVETGALPGSWEPHRDNNGLPFAVRNFSSIRPEDRPLRVAVTCAADMGDVAVSNVVLPLLEQLDPRCLAMCGVCAGRPEKTSLGDVVAADKLYFHDTGKRIGKTNSDNSQVYTVQQDLSTFLLRSDWKRALEIFNPKVEFANAAWLIARPIPILWQELRAMVWLEAHPDQVPSRDWIRRNCPQWDSVYARLTSECLVGKRKLRLTAAGRVFLRSRKSRNAGRLPDLSPLKSTLPFKLHVGSFASGDQVVEDEAIWTFVTQSMRKTLGLDMEAAAIGAIVHYQRVRNLSAIVMKGVMDFANHGRDDHFKDFAARASAECLITFLRKNFKTEVIPGFDDLLTDGTIPRPVTPSPSQLLDARHGFVPWHAGSRAALLVELDEWVDKDPSAVSVRLVHADGGIGKTRLAIEWIRRRRQRYDVAGFLVHRPPVDWLERICLLGSRRVIVIDYAEIRADLGDLLERFSNYERQSGNKRTVRILLLARNASDWWISLTTRSSSLKSLLGDIIPQELSPVAVDPVERERVFLFATQTFAEFRRMSTVPRYHAGLSDPRFDRVLYLHMAALASVVGSEYDVASLMDVILDHEERFWLQDSSSADIADNRRDARQLLAAATLLGGLCTREHTLMLLARMLGPYVHIGDRHTRLITRLHEIYARPFPGAIYIPGLEPDLLGEGLVQRLADPPISGDRVAEGWIDSVVVAGESIEVLRTVFTVLGRATNQETVRLQGWIEKSLSFDLMNRSVPAFEAAKIIGRRTAFSALGDILAARLSIDGTAELAQALKRTGLPNETVSLRRAAEWITRTLHEGTLSKDATNENLAEMAGLSNDLGLRLGDLGRHEEALVPSQKAVEDFRILAHRNPSKFLPSLAMSLNNLGVRLRKLGRRNDALAPLFESVAIRRMLSQQYPEVFRRELAGSLSNLGALLGELGRHVDAISSSQESVEILRELAQRDPSTFLPRLAGSLNNLGIRLRYLGRVDEAAEAFRSAVGFSRTLSQKNPDAHLPIFATSLDNLANLLREQGRPAEVRPWLKEVVDIRRALVDRHPAAFNHDLAIGLVNLGIRLFEDGDHGDGIAHTLEAVGILRRLASLRPVAYIPYLVTTLNNLRIQYERTGKLVEASACADEIAEVQGSLVNLRSV